MKATMLNPKHTVKIFTQAEDLFAAAAKDFCTRSIHIIASQGKCRVVLSGGETPKKFYAALVQHAKVNTEIAWNKIQFFFGDERYVPMNDVRSNYYTAQHYLFSQLSIPRQHIFRFPTELATATEVATGYEQTLKAIFTTPWPQFDLIYLGLGEDGHTASLMPGSALVQQYLPTATATLPSSWVASLWAEALNMYRITLTPPAINHSQHRIFLVEGAAKASALQAVWQPNADPGRYPAALVDSAEWWVDAAAARGLVAR